MPSFPHSTAHTDASPVSDRGPALRARTSRLSGDGAGAPLISLRDVHFAYPGAVAPDAAPASPAASQASGFVARDDTGTDHNDGLEALRGITLDIWPGEHVCILGGNGSGKSTLVQLMNALLTPTSGTVEAFGYNAADPEGAAQIRRRAAMVFQHPDDQMVTSIVADDVAFGPENLGIPQPEIVQRVDAALAAVDMTELAQADPADLSGGQRQRVAIAGALAMQPKALLLDEPSAMLDAQGHRAVQRIVERLNRRGIAIVHVTHFMDDALAADRVVVLERGRIALEGTPDDVFARRDLVRSLGLEQPFTLQLADRLATHLPGLPLTGKTDALAEAIARAVFPQGASLPGTADRGARSARAEAMSSDDSSARAAHPNASAPKTARDRQDDAIVFDHVSFSYADDANPRKRRLFGRKRSQHGVRHVPLALDDVCLTVPRGSLTALIGCTGSGKSTSVELACALKLPRSGHVVVGGVDTSDLERRHELRSQIGYVSQLPERQLFAETVLDDVAFGPRNLHLDSAEVDRRVHDALTAVGLDPTPALLGRSPFALSGGQQRSVAIAGVLAMQTPMLVLDEPMAGLDPAGRARMRSLIQTLRASGVTLLMVTHSMDDVAELADHVVVLDHGKVVAEGSPRQVFEQTPCPAPGLPAPLAFTRALAAHGVALHPAPLTLDDLVTALTNLCKEVFDHGATR
ncbi:hypothetical protein B5F33_09575 [Collinsella sp. An2]|nr:hypothetical protein B5F33_09575 [Collinsella sp. An2]